MRLLVGTAANACPSGQARQPHSKAYGRMIASPKTRTVHLIVLLVIAIQCLINSLDLTTYPTVGQDEVMLNDPARELARSGELRTTVFGGRYDFDKIYLFQPFGQALAMAAVYKVVGFGLLQTRLPGVLLAGVCIWLLYYWVYRASGSLTAGGTAGLLLALNPGFMATSRAGRMDVLCILFSLAGLILITEFCLAKSSDAPTGYLTLSGSLMGIAAVMHMNGIAFLAATGVLLLTMKGPSLPRRVRNVLSFGFPAALPLAAWLVFALMHGREVFENQFLKHASMRSAADVGLLARIPAELARQVQSYSRTPLFLLCFLAGSVWLLRQSSDQSKMIGPFKVLLVVTCLFNTFVMGKASGFYQLYPSIAFAIAAALMFSALFRNGTIRARLCLSIPLVLLAINSVAVIYGPRWLAWRFQQPMRQYQNLDRDIAALDVAGKTVLGDGPEWYAVERLGGRFEIPYFGFVRPDASKQDFVIVHASSTAAAEFHLSDFSKVREIGTIFPRVFGSQLTDQDYRLVVFRSNTLEATSFAATQKP